VIMTIIAASSLAACSCSSLAMIAVRSCTSAFMASANRLANSAAMRATSAPRWWRCRAPISALASAISWRSFARWSASAGEREGGLAVRNRFLWEAAWFSGGVRSSLSGSPVIVPVRLRGLVLFADDHPLPAGGRAIRSSPGACRARLREQRGGFAPPWESRRTSCG